MNILKKAYDFVKKFMIPIALFFGGIAFVFSMMKPRDTESERVEDLEKYIKNKIDSERNRINKKKEEVEKKREDRIKRINNKINNKVDGENNEPTTANNSIDRLSNNWPL